MGKRLGWALRLLAPDGGGSGGGGGGTAGAGAGGAAAGGAGAGAGGGALSLLGDVTAGSQVAEPGKHPADTGGTGADPAKAGKEAAPATRPDWLPEQFFDPATGQPRLEQMAKSWTDLRGKLSQGAEKPPAKADDYKVTLPDGIKIAIPDGDPVMSTFRESAHKAGMSQKQFDAVLQPVLAKLAGLQPNPEQQRADAEALQRAELAKLGANGEAQLRDLSGWLGGLVSRGSLTPAELGEIRIMAATADGVRALQKLRSLAGEAPVPIDPAAMTSGGMALEDAYALKAKMWADPKLNTPENQRKVSEAIAAAEKAGLLQNGPPRGIGVR